MKNLIQEFEHDRKVLKIKIGIIFIGMICFFLASCGKSVSIKPKTETASLSEPIKGLVTIYDSVRIGSPALENIFASLSNATFSQKLVDGKVNLSCSIIPDQWMKPLSSGTLLSGNRVLSKYYLGNLKPLVSQYTPGSYLVLKAADYKEINPAYTNYVYYTVTMYNKTGERMQVNSFSKTEIHIDPCPPAKPE